MAEPGNPNVETKQLGDVSLPETNIEFPANPVQNPDDFLRQVQERDNVLRAKDDKKYIGIAEEKRGLMRRLMNRVHQGDMSEEDMITVLANYTAQSEINAELDPNLGEFGVYGKSVLGKRLAIATKLAKDLHIPISVGVLDLDYFKTVNDTFGHAAGDIALSSFVQYLRLNIRESDEIVRNGGDEFVVIFYGADRNGVGKHLNEINEHMGRDIKAMDEFKKPGINYSVSMSVGVAGSEELKPTEELNTLVKIGDKRAYEAKAQGRNRVIYEDVAA